MGIDREKRKERSRGRRRVGEGKEDEGERKEWEKWRKNRSAGQKLRVVEGRGEGGKQEAEEAEGVTGKSKHTKTLGQLTNNSEHSTDVYLLKYINIISKQEVVKEVHLPMGKS